MTAEVLKFVSGKRLPPCDLRAEHSVIGTLLSLNRLILKVSERLKEWHFADPLNEDIYAYLTRRHFHVGHVDAPDVIDHFEGEEDQTMLKRHLGQCLVESDQYLILENARLIIDFAKQRRTAERQTSFTGGEIFAAGMASISRRKIFDEMVGRA